MSIPEGEIEIKKHERSDDAIDCTAVKPVTFRLLDDEFSFPLQLWHLTLFDCFSFERPFSVKRRLNEVSLFSLNLTQFSDLSGSEIKRTGLAAAPVTKAALLTTSRERAREREKREGHSPQRPLHQLTCLSSNFREQHSYYLNSYFTHDLFIPLLVA